MTDPIAEFQNIHHRYVAELCLDITWNGKTATGLSELLPSAWASGTERVRIGTLATLADIVGGHTPDGPVTPTTDMRIRLTGKVPTLGQITLTGRPLKAGRRLIVCEVTLCGPDGQDFAVATTTFLNNRFEQEHQFPSLAESDEPRVPSLEKLVGANAIDERTLEVKAVPAITNYGGTIQGGVQAYVSELAAEHIFVANGTGANGLHPRVVDLQIRFMGAVAVGPLRARATIKGKTGPLHAVSVELTDAGNDNRIVSFVEALVEA